MAEQPLATGVIDEIRGFRVLRGCCPAVALASVPPSSRADNSPETITVYNAQHASLTKEWVEGFTKETGIKVVLRNGERHRVRQPDRRRKAQPRRPTCS